MPATTASSSAWPPPCIGTSPSWPAVRAVASCEASPSAACWSAPEPQAASTMTRRQASGSAQSAGHDAPCRLARDAPILPHPPRQPKRPARCTLRRSRRVRCVRGPIASDLDERDRLRPDVIAPRGRGSLQCVFEMHGPPPRPGQPLVVVAVIEEAQAFAHRVPTLVTGVGKVRAATATTWAAMAHRPSVILNLGTAGALRPGVLAAGIVHEIGAVLQHDVNGRAIATLVGSDPSPRLELGELGSGAGHRRPLHLLAAGP